MNNWNGIGNLVRDIELKKTGSGKSVCNFTLAINRGKDEVDFLDFVAWERTAEVLAQYTGKGTKIGVTGSVRKRDYENNDGQKVYITEIIAHQIHLIDSKKQTQPTQQKKQDNIIEPTLDITDMSDLPF